jgi:hypothetical protein
MKNEKALRKGRLFTLSEAALLAAKSRHRDRIETKTGVG